MTNIYLKGRLGKEFGEHWKLEVKTPKEALHAINVNTDGRFVRYMEKTSRERKVGYVFMVGDQVVDNKDKIILIEGPHGSNEDIIVTPVVGGSYGFTTVIINLVIAVVAAVVSAMLAPSPNVDLGSNNDSARKDSYLFSGGPQPAKQGKPVPVGYGRMIIYPIPISVQYEYSQNMFGNTATQGIGGNNYNTWGESGGYYDYNNIFRTTTIF
jgi:predicted phage tail protein